MYKQTVPVVWENEVLLIKEQAHIIFEKVDDGIYKIIKDRGGKYTGQMYAGTKEVIEALDMDLKVAIFDRSMNGLEKLIYYNNAD